MGDKKLLRAENKHEIVEECTIALEKALGTSRRNPTARPHFEVIEQVLARATNSDTRRITAALHSLRAVSAAATTG